MRCSFLQNSTLTIEEFHSKLQEATNFPLRPFVIPFLKVIKGSTLPDNRGSICKGPAEEEKQLPVWPEQSEGIGVLTAATGDGQAGMWLDSGVMEDVAPSAEHRLWTGAL